jgi:hypothetical protein
MNPSARPTRDFGTRVLRALRSTIVICGVALLISALRRGRFEWSDSQFLMVHYWGIGMAVFVFVMIWDFWFQRAQRRRIVDQRENDLAGR